MLCFKLISYLFVISVIVSLFQFVGTVEQIVIFVILHDKKIILIFSFVAFELFNHVLCYSNFDIFRSLKFLLRFIDLFLELMILIFKNRIALNLIVYGCFFVIEFLLGFSVFLYLFVFPIGLFVHAGIDVDMLLYIKY